MQIVPPNPLLLSTSEARSESNSCRPPLYNTIRGQTARHRYEVIPSFPSKTPPDPSYARTDRKSAPLLINMKRIHIIDHWDTHASVIATIYLLLGAVSLACFGLCQPHLQLRGHVAIFGSISPWRWPMLLFRLPPLRESYPLLSSPYSIPR